MNETIKNHVAKYNESKGWPVTEESIAETIREGKTVWQGNHDDSRWWVNFFHVVEINGMKIGFWDSLTTGDDSPSDKGWEFDPSTICEVVEKTETVVVTTYEPAK